MNAKRNIETRGRTMTTKAIFLLAGKPDKAIKITVKKLKKLGHHIKFCKNIKSLPALDGDDILVVNINNVSEIKRELENRTDAVYIVHDYISCCYTKGIQETYRDAKENAERIDGLVLKYALGPDGMDLSKEKYRKQVMEEYTALVGHATREQTEQLTTLKSVLLNINGRNMIYNAMRFQEMNGLILKRLYFSAAGMKITTVRTKKMLMICWMSF